MNIKNISQKLTELNQPKYRIDQILKAIFQENVFDFNDIINLPKKLREELSKEDILCFDVSEIFKSSDLKTIKALIKLEDGKFLETVLIKNSKGYTVCVSSQIGCAVNCAFCATGQNGFKRNLTHEEITDQILFWKKFIKENNINSSITNIVYMGMGEPFLNYENFVQSIKNLTDKDLYNFSDRSISISTSFVDPDKMKDFFKNFPQINLAISLHFSDNEKRSTYMPINNKHDLNSIKKFLNYYLETYNRKILIEYLMLDNINDSERDANKLIDFIKSIEKNYLIHVNVIPYNSTYKNFKTTPFEKIVKFENLFKRQNIDITLRKSYGEDINAACGQLAGKK